jgi:hypothetical protein
MRTRPLSRPAYNGGAVRHLIAAAQDHLVANADHVTHVRLVSQSKR